VNSAIIRIRDWRNRRIPWTNQESRAANHQTGRAPRPGIGIAAADRAPRPLGIHGVGCSASDAAAGRTPGLRPRSDSNQPGDIIVALNGKPVELVRL
jgi:hypothetical protein